MKMIKWKQNLKKVPGDKWKWKFKLSDHMGYNTSGSKKQVNGSIDLNNEKKSTNK